MDQMPAVTYKAMNDGTYEYVSSELSTVLGLALISIWKLVRG